MLLTSICLLLLSLGTAVAGTARDPSQGGIALGATITLGNQTVFSRAGLLDYYASLVGRMPAVVNVGSDWVHFPDFNSSVMEAIRSRGAVPMWTWLPDNYNLPGNQPAFKLTAIASGAYDDYIRRFAGEAKSWGYPFLLRFAHEMNATWYSWSTGAGNPNGNSPDDYIAAWRHVHDLFTEVGATNALWVWCVNTELPRSTPIAQDYPGDAYVDWVAMDGYNFGTTPPNGSWRSLVEVFGPTYDAIGRLSARPLMISEVASAETGGDKADWITEGLLNALPAAMPRVRAVLWFDAVDGADWRVDSSPASLSAFRQVVASPTFQAQFDPYAPDEPYTQAAMPPVQVGRSPRTLARRPIDRHSSFRWGAPPSPIPL